MMSTEVRTALLSVAWGSVYLAVNAAGSVASDGCVRELCYGAKTITGIVLRGVTGDAAPHYDDSAATQILSTLSGMVTYGGASRGTVSQLGELYLSTLPERERTEVMDILWALQEKTKRTPATGTFSPLLRQVLVMIRLDADHDDVQALEAVYETMHQVFVENTGFERNHADEVVEHHDWLTDQVVRGVLSPADALFLASGSRVYDPFIRRQFRTLVKHHSRMHQQWHKDLLTRITVYALKHRIGTVVGFGEYMSLVSNTDETLGDDTPLSILSAMVSSPAIGDERFRAEDSHRVQEQENLLHMHQVVDNATQQQDLVESSDDTCLITSTGRRS